jgi:DNA-binding NarL/FixJ family response regulator
MKESPLEKQLKELQILHTIALELNATTELNQALKIGLTHTIQLMNMQTGWIWLLHPDSNSVFLAASHQLPPAFTQHPERLSGWCYCIDKYLANKMDSASNISEITCTRLKDLQEGTKGLRYHATVPLYDQDEKIGLLNLLSEASGQLSDRQLDLLHSIGDVLSITISRTRLYEQSREAGIREERKRLARHIGKELIEQIQQLKKELSLSKSPLSNAQKLNELAKDLSQLAEQSIRELEATAQSSYQQHPFQYPITPLSNREMEVLELLKSGKTNKAIAAELFISERTVKFHVSTLLSKLQAQNRTDAVQIAVRRGLIKF